MKYNEIENSFKNNNLKIINVIKFNNYQFDNKGRKTEFTEEMTKSEIKEFFTEFEKKLEKKVEKGKYLCLIILNEYFFSYHIIINDDNYKFIMEKSKEITKKFPNIILYINLCHEIEKNTIPMIILKN